MNVACDYEAPMQMLTTEKYIAPRAAKWVLAFTHLKNVQLSWKFQLNILST